MEYVIRIRFKVITNEDEYEALLFDLRVKTKLEVKSLDVYSDSRLMVNRVQGDYLAKDLQMVTNLDEVKAISMKIKYFKIEKFLERRTRKLMPWLT